MTMKSPSSEPNKQEKHTFSVLVENRFGVLSRVAGLFSTRGYNIDSLVVSPTENKNYSRMTNFWGRYYQKQGSLRDYVGKKLFDEFLLYKHKNPPKK